jgi:hypothetical protein
LTGSTEENWHPAWDLYTISSGGHTSQKTTNGRLTRHKDTKIILKWISGILAERIRG